MCIRDSAYDYARNELLLDENGCTYLVEGNAALRIWIFKALTTARFRHVAYSPVSYTHLDVYKRQGHGSLHG